MTLDTQALKEAAEKAGITLCGFASGNYSATCMDCNERFHNTDKRSIRCFSCAQAARIEQLEAENARLKEAVADIERAAFEKAAAWHRIEIERLEQQIIKNNVYGKRSGHQQTASEANVFCRETIGHHKVSIFAILSLIPATPEPKP